MKIINLFAGPCTGKSTLAYDLMSRMKKLGLKVELIPDTPRDEVFSESWKRLNDHLLQLTTLQHKLNMLKDVGLDYVVMESPILMRLAYAENEPDIIKDLIVGLHNEQDSINVNLLRNPKIAYDETGRDQNFEQAQERTKITEDLVRRYINNPINIMAGVRDVSSIFKELNLEDKISIKENSNQNKNDLIKALPEDSSKYILLICKSLYPYAGKRESGEISINALNAQEWEIKNGIEAKRGDAFAKLFYDQLHFKLSALDLHPYASEKELAHPFNQSVINNTAVEKTTILLTPSHSEKWKFDDIGNIFIDTAKEILKDMKFTAPIIEENILLDIKNPKLKSQKKTAKIN